MDNLHILHSLRILDSLCNARCARFCASLAARTSAFHQACKQMANALPPCPIIYHHSVTIIKTFRSATVLAATISFPRIFRGAPQPCQSPSIRPEPWECTLRVLAPAVRYRQSTKRAGPPTPCSKECYHRDLIEDRRRASSKPGVPRPPRHQRRCSYCDKWRGEQRSRSSVRYAGGERVGRSSASHRPPGSLSSFWSRGKREKRIKCQYFSIL